MTPAIIVPPFLRGSRASGVLGQLSAQGEHDQRIALGKIAQMPLGVNSITTMANSPSRIRYQEP